MRTAFIYIFQIFYLLAQLPKLRQIKDISNEKAEERGRLIHEQPRRWAKTTLNLAGAKVKIKGVEKIPEGPVLMAANHQGNFDIMVLLAYLDKPFGFFSKIEVKRIPVVRSWMEAMHCVFVDRKNKTQALQAVNQGIDYLKEGHSLMIFPEGTRTFGKGLKGFKSGGLRMGTHAGVPIVPIAIEGTYKVMEANEGKIKPATVVIHVCDPIMPEYYNEMHMNDLADLVRRRIEEQLVLMGGNTTLIPGKRDVPRHQEMDVQG